MTTPSTAARIALALLPPVLVAGAGGALLVRQAQAEHRADQGDVRLAESTRRIADLVTALQNERGSAGGGAATDAALSAVDGDPLAATGDLLGRLDELENVRAVIVPGRSAIGYGEITAALLDRYAVLAGQVDDIEVRDRLSIRHRLAQVRDELDLNRSLIADAIAAGGLEAASAQAARSALARGLAADPALVPAESLAAWRETAAEALPPAKPFRNGAVSAPQWKAVTGTVLAALDRSSAEQAAAAERRAAAESKASQAWLTWLLIGLGVLLVAAVLPGVLLLRRLGSDNTALEAAVHDVAVNRLPELLQRIRDGRFEGDKPPGPPELPAELGPVAAAVDAICGEAVAAAAAQRTMRNGYAQVFSNMFRRTQTLVQRQLQLVERLEKAEQNPEHLTRLFQLDHLIVRMRRHNENVLVLSGTELVRKSATPASVASIIQAARAEVEAYQRVESIDPPQAEITGAAASDLVRLLAELIDNATSFSAPESTVAVQAQVLRDGSLSIAVIDEGIGMSDEEVLAANERLTRLGSTELARSRRVGLLVVGRLAGRHGFGIELLGGDRSVGVTALVSVPAEVVVGAERPGWADRRHALKAASQRRKSAAALEPAPAAPRTTQAPADERSKELVEQAHANVPAELPVRTPNKQIGKTLPDPKARVASGWFAARNTAGQQRAVSVAPGAAPAEEGWSVLATAGRPRTYEYTEDGLPIREAGKHLVPGSAKPAGDREARAIERDAGRTRSRLSSFQTGVRKAKAPDGTGRPARLAGWKSLGKKTTAELSAVAQPGPKNRKSE
jgi:signal transduction histidine kinase